MVVSPVEEVSSWFTSLWRLVPRMLRMLSDGLHRPFIYSRSSMLLRCISQGCRYAEELPRTAIGAGDRPRCPPAGAPSQAALGRRDAPQIIRPGSLVRCPGLGVGQQGSRGLSLPVWRLGYLQETTHDRTPTQEPPAATLPWILVTESRESWSGLPLPRPKPCWVRRACPGRHTRARGRIGDKTDKTAVTNVTAGQPAGGPPGTA